MPRKQPRKEVDLYDRDATTVMFTVDLRDGLSLYVNMRPDDYTCFRFKWSEAARRYVRVDRAREGMQAVRRRPT